MLHNFHIPVMGLAFTIDSPLKVGKYGINSVVSIGNDDLIEDMRAHYCNEYGIAYEPITKSSEDSRARRISAYLNLLDQLIKDQIAQVRNASLDTESELTKYLDLIPEDAPLKRLYAKYKGTSDEELKNSLAQEIRQRVEAGSIDVNIMTKLNKPNHDKEGNELPPEYADALAAFRGYAKSNLISSVVFSAGFNPRLYGYIDQFEDFLPDENGKIRKKIILKVSDYRSALIQGKYLAKKGIWVSEFRIESGLNCGGHAFPTEGLLMGPILEQFRANRENLRKELFELCQTAWSEKLDYQLPESPVMKLSVQGGIGTAEEHNFLRQHYGVDSTGWGTPFLLVPEATTVDEETLEQLILAREKDLFLSQSSPLGVPFNNLRQSGSEQVREARIAKGRPGSPCLKKHLVSNTEFTEEPICTASRKYQYFKLKELKSSNLEKVKYQKAYQSVIAKACLCEDLAGSAYKTYDMKADLPPAPAICPGPNLAYFSNTYSLKEMIDHIYGRFSILSESNRPHMFIKELRMYLDYLEKEWEEFNTGLSDKKEAYFKKFKRNLESGISYYQEIISQIEIPSFGREILKYRNQLAGIC